MSQRRSVFLSVRSPSNMMRVRIGGPLVVMAWMATAPMSAWALRPQQDTIRAHIEDALTFVGLEEGEQPTPRELASRRDWLFGHLRRIIRATQQATQSPTLPSTAGGTLMSRREFGQLAAGAATALGVNPQELVLPDGPAVVPTDQALDLWLTYLMAPGRFTVLQEYARAFRWLKRGQWNPIFFLSLRPEVSELTGTIQELAVRDPHLTIPRPEDLKLLVDFFFPETGPSGASVLDQEVAEPWLGNAPSQDDLAAWQRAAPLRVRHREQLMRHPGFASRGFLFDPEDPERSFELIGYHMKWAYRASVEYRSTIATLLSGGQQLSSVERRLLARLLEVVNDPTVAIHPQTTQPQASSIQQPAEEQGSASRELPSPGVTALLPAVKILPQLAADVAALAASEPVDLAVRWGTPGAWPEASLSSIASYQPLSDRDRQLLARLPWSEPRPAAGTVTLLHFEQGSQPRAISHQLEDALGDGWIRFRPDLGRSGDIGFLIEGAGLPYTALFARAVAQGCVVPFAGLATREAIDALTGGLSTVAGQIVQARFVATDGADIAEARQAARALLTGQIAPEQRGTLVIIPVTDLWRTQLSDQIAAYLALTGASLETLDDSDRAVALLTAA